MRKAVFTTSHLHYITLAVICQVIAAFFLGSAPVSANTNNFYFSDFTADYYLEATADASKLKVTEQLTAEFPTTDQNHGIERAIPFTNQGGANLTAPTINDLHFTATRNNQPENIAATDTKDGFYIFRLGDSDKYLHDTQKYQLAYEFTNVVTDQDGFQELYWDTNGTGWHQRFDQLTANFHLEKSLLSQLSDDTWCYVGTQGSNNQSRCTTTRTDDGFSFAATDLKPGENLTFVVNFAAGTFIVPAPRANNTILVLFTIGAALFVVAIIVFIINYRKHIYPHRHYYKHLFTPPQYTPDKDHTVADAAAIYLKTTKAAQVPTLLELAVNHKIELVKDDKTWRIKIKNANNLTTAQTAVLQILKGSDQINTGDEFTIQRQKYSTTSAAHNLTFRNAPTEALKEQDYFTAKTPRNVVLPLLTLGELILCGIVFYCVDSASTAHSELFPALGILLLATAVLAAVHNHLKGKYTARTEKGLDLSNYYQGLKDYIQLAETDRLKFLQSVDGADTTAQGIVKLYEKVLPYAALFGLEKSWLAELNKYYEENPDLSPNWYSGATYFTFHDFSQLSTRTTNSYSSASSSSSSSSGSGGGGFSGGGGGGGGGGGW